MPADSVSIAGPADGETVSGLNWNRCRSEVRRFRESPVIKTKGSTRKQVQYALALLKELHLAKPNDSVNLGCMKRRELSYFIAQLLERKQTRPREHNSVASASGRSRGEHSEIHA